VGNTLYLHGHGKHGVLSAAVQEGEICVEVSLVDGLVLARSAMHHSVNYRSVIVHGTPREVTGQDKIDALEAMMVKITPDRVAGIRGPNAQELKATLVVAIELTEAAGKQRSGMPIDDEEDYALPVWAGVVPISEVQGTPQQDMATRPPKG
jgi:nitroimidazol reductase NimA-like FMN-containing flavoprotein (pyridoxamine 5'-phosphate oxidase superfamily)